MVDTFTPPRAAAVDDSNAADALPRRNAMRRELRAARAALVGAERDHATRLLNDRLIAHLLVDHGRDVLGYDAGKRGHGPDGSQDGDRICDIASLAGYVAVASELDIAGTMAVCRQRDIVTLLPVLDGDSLVFSPYDDDTLMAPNRFGIDEPDRRHATLVRAMDIDVVLVPLVGFDTRCERMGMGGGFYDRSFATRRECGPRPWLIGVAFDCQGAEDVLPDWWDVPLDAVVTETTVHRRPA